jgi:hypothetical protein
MATARGCSAGVWPVADGPVCLAKLLACLRLGVAYERPAAT